VTTVQMPQLGETIIEGTILKWLKSEGDAIERDEPLFEISTDKVDTEVPSPVSGTVSKILVQEGQTVPVGTELAEIDSEGAAGTSASSTAAAQRASDTDSSAAAEASSAEAPAAAASEASSAEAPAAAGSAEAPEASEPSSTEETAAATQATGHPSVPARREAVGATAEGGPRSKILSPLVRRLAEEHDLDLSQVRGTGTGGRITKNDVMAAISSGGAAPAAAASGGGPAVAPVQVPTPAVAGAGEEVVPMSHIRKAIATHMVASLQASARAWNMVEVDMESVVRVRDRAKDAFKAREGFGLTYTPFVTRAVTEALLTSPMVNAELRGEEIVVKHYVNMGIAVSYDEGLIVPVVKGADTMNIVGLARAINDLATRARAKKLLPDEVHGATFSITNPGPFGSILSVPIINQPNTAILAFDAIEKRPVVIDDAIAIRHMVYISMSWDHRVIDGALASQFLARVKQNLETWDWSEDLGS
jgi:pyruvate dehydrogenase E2 component (dihydrolipoyllysine-residue acetyltransferase)